MGSDHFHCKVAHPEKNRSGDQGDQSRIREVSRTARLEFSVSILRIAIREGVLCQVLDKYILSRMRELQETSHVWGLDSVLANPVEVRFSMPGGLG